RLRAARREAGRQDGQQDHQDLQQSQPVLDHGSGKVSGRAGLLARFPANEELNRNARAIQARALCSGRIGQRLRTAVLEVLVEPPTFDLGEYLVKLFSRQRFVDEAFATPELAEVPRVKILKLGRHSEFPERQILRQVSLQRLFGTVERAHIPMHDFRSGAIRYPPQRLESILDDLSQTELFGHIDLRG